MISSGRYGYHLSDIAEIQAKAKPLSPIDEMRLGQMLREVAEYETANGIPSTQPEPPPTNVRAGVVPNGQTCKHGIPHFCGFCSTGTEPSSHRM